MCIRDRCWVSRRSAGRAGSSEASCPASDTRCTRDARGAPQRRALEAGGRLLHREPGADPRLAVAAGPAPASRPPDPGDLRPTWESGARLPRAGAGLRPLTLAALPCSAPAMRRLRSGPVSYTHLTLPTSDLV